MFHICPDEIAVIASIMSAPLWARGLWWKFKGWVRPVRDQTTWCFCPSCGTDLVSSGAVFRDSGCVHYHCTCGTHSQWCFEIPTPSLLSYHRD